MSKGDRNRSVTKEFKDGFDSIKWSGKPSKFMNRKRERVENKSARVWSDLEPYKAVGGDMAGKMVDGRRAHREMLKRSGCVEVGNEKDYFFKHDGKSDDNPTKDW